MTVVLTALGLLACVAIALIGLRFLVRPDVATRGFGVPVGDVRALTAVKGARDITSGLVPAIVLIAAGSSAFGWAFVGAAVTPIADMLIVLTKGTAFTVHGLTATVLLALGLTLALTS